MATTTPNFGWDIPQSTDLVKDGATAIAALGNDIDTALVDLKGGTTGQVLSKNSNTDLDFVWVAQDDSNAIQNTIVDAKGDLISATGADVPARLAVGTDGQLLSADSTASTGLKWITSTQFVPFVTPVKTGEFLGTPPHQGTTESSVNASLDTTYYSPIFLPGCALDRIGFRVATASQSGTSTVRLGIYNMSTTTALPTSVYLDAGTVNATNAAASYTITISNTPPAGWYYLAINVQNDTGTNRLISTTTSYSFMPNLTATIDGNGVDGFTQSGVTGAFATATSLANLTTAQFPYIYVRMA